MPKKRKTRKQKISLDQKRQTVHEITPSVTTPQKIETQKTEQETMTSGVTFALPITTHETQRQKVEAVTVSSNEYGYLGNDLMRTALLTSAIIFAELLIRLFFVH